MPNMLHWPILVVMAETACSANKIFTNWPFTKIVYQSLIYRYQIKLFLGDTWWKAPEIYSGFSKEEDTVCPLNELLNE